MTSDVAGALASRSTEQRLALVLVLASTLHFLGHNAADPDLWGHLEYGSRILAGDGLPKTEIYSYTAAGAPFYDHEWGADVVIAGLFQIGGPVALILFKLVLGLAVVALLAWQVPLLDRLRGEPGRTGPSACAAALVLALAVIGPGATFRPQLFTMLFLALLAALLVRADVRWTEGGQGARRVGPELLAVPPLLGLWANLHGGFLVGVGAFGLFVLAILRRVAVARGVGIGDAVRVAALGLLGLAAPVVNPYGIELYTYLFATLGMHDVISEWHPVSLFGGDFLRFKLMVVATVLATVALLRSAPRDRDRAVFWDWAVPLLVLAAVFAFRHQRHTVLFAELSAPILALALGELVRRTDATRVATAAVRRAVALGVLAVVAVQLGGYGARLWRGGAEIRFSRFDYPVDAVEFMRTHEVHGNAAFPFEWGAFAIRKLAPDVRVFIDGRFEAAYPPEIIHDYFAFTDGTPGWEDLLDDYPTDIVVVQRARGIHPRLFARPDLQYIYSDPTALIFVKRTARTARMLARLQHTEPDDRRRFARLENVFP